MDNIRPPPANPSPIQIAYPLLLPLWQLGSSMAAKAGITLDVNALPRQAVLLTFEKEMEPQRHRDTEERPEI